MNDKYHILLINGPNLNLLGQREINYYGYNTLDDVILDLYKLSDVLKVNLHHFQSNAEHDLINRIHKAKNVIDYILINPAGLTHTSIVLRDALLSINIPFIEVHISNIYAREKFRHHSYLSDIAVGIVCGLGINSYFLALQAAVKNLSHLKK